MKKLLIALLCIIFATPAMADKYVRDCNVDSSCGSANGSDWSNPYDQLSSAETAATRGETIWVGDGTYGTVTFNTPVSDSTYIYVKKATAAAHGTETGWNSAYGDGVATISPVIDVNSDYWWIDGQGFTTATSGHGFKIQNTACSDQGIGLDESVNNVTLRYIDVQGNGDDGGDGNCVTGRNDLIYAAGSGADTLTIQYCYFHDSGGTHFLTRSADGWLVEHNYFARNQSVSEEHAEPFSIGDSSDWVFRYNIVDDTEGTGVIVALDVATGPDNWSIYGNQFSNFSSNNGAITTDTGSSWTASRVYNNTFVNGVGISQGITPDSGGAGWEVYNNIWYNCVNVNFDTPHDYNASDDDLGETHDQTIASNIFTNYAGGDFTLSSGTTAGTTIASPYDMDMLGVTRGADGTWDRGAYEYTDAVPTPTPIPRGAASATIRNGSIH